MKTFQIPLALGQAVAYLEHFVTRDLDVVSLSHVVEKDRKSTKMTITGNPRDMAIAETRIDKLGGLEI